MDICHRSQKCLIYVGNDSAEGHWSNSIMLRGEEGNTPECVVRTGRILVEQKGLSQKVEGYMEYMIFPCSWQVKVSRTHLLFSSPEVSLFTNFLALFSFIMFSHVVDLILFLINCPLK